MRGPKPTPTALKIINGNPGKRALPKGEPIPVGDLSEAPDFLSESQRDGWGYVVANAPENLLKLIDKATLTAFVIAEDLHRQAAEHVQRHGMLIKGPKGIPIQNPYLSVLKQQAVVLMRAASEMGFTPSGRTRIKVDPPAKKANQFSEFVGGPRKTRA